MKCRMYLLLLLLISSLILSDAVSEPELNYTCTPDGKVEFHCFLEKGANPSFTWSLIFKTLDGTSAPHSVKSQTLVLKDITGYVVCTAENSVSKQQSPIVFYSCEGRGRQPIDIRLSVMAVTRRGLPIENITGAEALVESCGDGEPQKKKQETEQSISSSRGETLGSPVKRRFSKSIWSNKNLLNGIDILWKRGTVPVARLKESTVFYYGDYENKANIFTNGTLRLDKIDDADTGPYSVVVSDANGRNINSEIAQLFMINIIPFQTVDSVLGSSLLLLLKNIANSSAIEWRKDNRSVAGFKQEAPYYNENYKDRASMFANGTLRLDKTQNTDSGSYSIVVFDKAFKECPQANGSMGSSVVLFLNNEDHIHFSNIEWKKGNSLVAKLKDSAPHYYGDYRNRAEIFNNGTLILHETQGTDTGNYSVEFFDTNGNVRFKWITQLLIVAPPGIETGSMYTADNNPIQTVPIRLGSCVIFQLNNTNMSESSDISWRMGHTCIGHLKNNNHSYCGTYKQRDEIFANGSLRLCNANTTDMGKYHVQVFDKDGKSRQTGAAELIMFVTGVFGGIIWFMIGGIGITVLLIVIAVSVLHCCLQKPQSQPDVEMLDFEHTQDAPIPSSVLQRKLSVVYTSIKIRKKGSEVVHFER
ncbi:UNVERIFIED_CONTAM: hypothetical protein FKN15_029549 [Acipenser sinensis]